MNKTKSTPKPGRIQSVDRALTIMDIISEADDGLTLAQIAQRIDLPKSTVHGLISTLRDHKYVRQADEDGRYLMGIRLFELGTKLARSWDIRDIAKPVMRRLSKEFGETVHLGCEDNGEVLYLDKIAPDSLINIVSEIGTRLPMHCSGIGKALLAHKSDSEVKRYISTKGLVPLTGRTITKSDAFIAELAKVREQGFALDDGEIMEGLRCVGAPIYDTDGLVRYAISVSGQVKDIYGKRLERLIIETRRAAKEISYALGKSRVQVK
ncbi:MAG: IclR family transcriptional regulator [Mogibacterium sp.]|nr:IclR family transcriptional regulator [Mogibacterium sp.]